MPASCSDAGVPWTRRSGLILFLTLLALLPPRLRDLDAPLLGAHAWRQTHTADVARNFFRRGMQLTLPEVSYRGATPRACEQEFPLYTWMVALAYRCLGRVDEGLGRLLSVLFSLVTASYLFFMARRLWGESFAAITVLVYGYFPLNLVFHRAFLPDNAMVTFSVALLWHFRCWLDEERPVELALAITMGALAFLCKIPTVYLGLPLLWLCWEKWGWACLRRGELWGTAIAMLAPSLLWYGHAHGHPVQFGMWNLGAANWGKSALWASKKYWATMAYFLHYVIFTEGGLVMAAGGLVLALSRPRERFLVLWAAAIAVYYIVVAEGNMRHSYYHLPTCAVGALLVVLPLHRLFERLDRNGTARQRNGARVAMVLAGIAFVHVSTNRALRIGQRQMQFDQLLPCAEALKRKSEPNEAIVSHFPHGEPELCYYADRCGWQMLWNDGSPATLRRCMNGGAGWIAFLYPPTGEEGRFYIPIRINADLERFGIEGNIFYDRGMYGYLVERLGPDHALFKPGSEKLRYFDYARALHRLVLRGDDRFDELLDRCDFEIFILFGPNPSSADLQRRLSTHPAFSLITSDGFNFCWVRKKPRWAKRLAELDLAPLNFHLDPLARRLPLTPPTPLDPILLAKERKLRALLSRNDEAPSFWLYLANVLAALGKSEAETTFAHLAELNETAGAMLMADYLVTRAEKPREAFTWLLRAARHAPKDANIPFKMALCHLRLNEASAARAKLNEALRLNPRLGPAWLVRAGMALNEGNREGARACAEEARRLGEDLSRLRGLLESK